MQFFIIFAPDMQSMEFHHVKVRPTEQIGSHEHPARERFIYGIMGAMENNYGCVLIHAKTGGQLPAEFTSSYHVHLLMRQGEMLFSDGKNIFTSRKDDLVIWQMSNTIQSVTYSDDFEADVLLASPGFLQQYNPEMVWASKGFLFIRINPSFHLDEESLRLMNADFELFRLRLALPDNSFKREVAFYADKLCITPKYLSQVARTVTNLPASQWIQFYAAFELVSLLNDTTKTLTEVSNLMHFENISHFSRYVKKTLGKTPSEYRNK